MFFSISFWNFRIYICIWDLPATTNTMLSLQPIDPSKNNDGVLLDLEMSNKTYWVKTEFSWSIEHNHSDSVDSTPHHPEVGESIKWKPCWIQNSIAYLFVCYLIPMALASLVKSFSLSPPSFSCSLRVLLIRTKSTSLHVSFTPTRSFSKTCTLSRCADLE